MKNTQKAKQFRKNKYKNRKSKKRTIGGEQLQAQPSDNTIAPNIDYRAIYIKNDINNIEMLSFVIGLLSTPDFKAKVIDKNSVYLNQITGENIGTSFDYFGNQEFRIFINDAIQWLLLDYNQDFFNSVLTVLINSFQRPDFLTDNDPFNVILFELDKTITLKINQNTENKKEMNDNIVLLKIILEVLTTIPNLSNTLKGIFQNKDTIKILNQYSKSIICILQKLITMDIKTNTNVRNLITGYFKNQNISVWGIIQPALSIVSSCGGSVVSNVVSNMSSSAYSYLSNKK